MSEESALDCEKYREYMRPHTPAERAALEQSLLAEGCRDPLTVAVLADAMFLIDGFQRKAYCDANGIEYSFAEISFDVEDDILAWIERNSRGRRNMTRTERNYYLGCRYLRERKEPHRPKAGKECQLSAVRIAQEEACAERHVRNCAKFASHLNELCASGFAYLKWPILTEQMKYNRKLLEEIGYRAQDSAPLAVQASIEALLKEADGKPVSGNALWEVARGGEEPAEEPESKRPSQLVEPVRSALLAAMRHLKDRPKDALQEAAYFVRSWLDDFEKGQLI